VVRLEERLATALASHGFRGNSPQRHGRVYPGHPRLIAFSSEAETGSREENAPKQ
jgi:hypothetical protein